MSKRTEFSIVAVIIFILAGLLWAAASQPSQNSPQKNAGSFSPTGGTTYHLSSDIGYTDSTIRLTSFEEPVSNIPYTMSYLGSTIEFGTIAPQTNHSEFISFTGITQNSDGSATLTGVIRGLARTPGSGGCVASSTLQQPHSAQTILILSNPPCFYANYITNTNGNSNLIYSSNKFASTTYQGFDLDPGAAYFVSAASSTFVDQAQLNRLALTNCSAATYTVEGCVQLATARQSASSTVTGSTGANLVLPAVIATDTPTLATSSVVMSLMNGKIAQGWLDLTQAFTTTGQWIFSNLFTTNASSTNATTTNEWIKGLAVGSILKINSNQQVVAASLGVDYAGPQWSYGTTTATSTGTVSCSNSCNLTATSTQPNTVLTFPSGTISASSTIEVNIAGSCAGSQSSASFSCGAALVTNTGVVIWKFMPQSTQNPFSFFTTTVSSGVSNEVTIGTGTGTNNGSLVQANTVNLSTVTSLYLVAIANAASGAGNNANGTATISGYSIILRP